MEAWIDAFNAKIAGIPDIAAARGVTDARGSQIRRNHDSDYSFDPTAPIRVVVGVFGAAAVLAEHSLIASLPAILPAHDEVLLVRDWLDVQRERSSSQTFS